MFQFSYSKWICLRALGGLCGDLGPLGVSGAKAASVFVQTSTNLKRSFLQPLKSPKSLVHVQVWRDMGEQCACLRHTPPSAYYLWILPYWEAASSKVVNLLRECRCSFRPLYFQHLMLSQWLQFSSRGTHESLSQVHFLFFFFFLFSPKEWQRHTEAQNKMAPNNMTTKEKKKKSIFKQLTKRKKNNKKTRNMNI